MYRQTGTGISGRTLAGTLAVIAALLLLSTVASAHSPSGMQLSYDPVSQQISVTIAHQVPDPASHYVQEVIVKVNDQETATLQYSNQPATSSFTYTYPVNATQGDTLTVSASCSLGGSIQRSIAVSGDLTGDAAAGATRMTQTKAAPLAVILSFVSLVVYLVMRQRKSL